MSTSAHRCPHFPTPTFAEYPVMLKAAMGGGGRGMRVVRTESEMADSFLRASNEALSAFGDGRMFVEK